MEKHLLRTCRPVIDVSWDNVEGSMLTPHRWPVRRAVDPDLADPETEYYPMPLQENLPTTCVPLRVGNDDVALDFQSPIDRQYLEDCYAQRLRTGIPSPQPPTTGDAAWAVGQIAVATAAAVAL